MWTRSLLLALLVLTAGSLTTPAQTKGKPKQPEVVTTSEVHFRESGAKDYSLWGYYATEAAARAVFDDLARKGYEVQLRISNTPIPKFDPPRNTGKLPVSETVGEKKVAEVFQVMAKQGDLAFRYPVDGCYARAQLMIERMQKQGLKPRKVWSVANGSELYAKTKNHPRGYVTWSYHVAPALRQLNADGTQRWIIIDPSLFSGPATLTQWMEAQMRDPGKKDHRPYLTISLPGEAPTWLDKKKRAGTGYWPGSDPKVGVHEHAVSIMRKYKPWEGKSPPKGAVRLDPLLPVPSRAMALR